MIALCTASCQGSNQTWYFFTKCTVRRRESTRTREVVLPLFPPIPPLRHQTKQYQQTTIRSNAIPHNTTRNTPHRATPHGTLYPPSLWHRQEKLDGLKALAKEYVKRPEIQARAEELRRLLRGEANTGWLSTGVGGSAAVPLQERSYFSPQPPSMPPPLNGDDTGVR